MIVDNHPLFAEGLKNLLYSNDFQTVDHINNGKKTVELILKGKPDVILMDIDKPGLDSIDSIEKVKEALPKTRIIVLTSFEEGSSMVKAIKAGASNYLLKSLDGEKLIKHLRDIKENLY